MEIFPEMEVFLTQTKKYKKAIQGLSAKKERLKQELDQSKETQRKQKMNEYRLEADYANLLCKLERIPPTESEVTAQQTGTEPWRI